jgi:hypothetical protein
MRKLFCLAALVTFATGAVLPGRATTVPMPNPDDGVVRKGVFTSPYFNMSYTNPHNN